MTNLSRTAGRGLALGHGPDEMKTMTFDSLQSPIAVGIMMIAGPIEA